MFSMSLFSRFTATCFVAALSLVATVPAHAQDVRLTIAPLVEVTRPAVGATQFTYDGTVTFDSNIFANGASFVAPTINVGGGVFQGLFFAFTTAFNDFLSTNAVVDRGTFTGPIMEFTVSSNSPIGLYDIGFNSNNTGFALPSLTVVGTDGDVNSSATSPISVRVNAPIVGGAAAPEPVLCGIGVPLIRGHRRKH
jgi:hypothetical protein